MSNQNTINFIRLFGVEGMIALAYREGATLSDKIREHTQSFPFLEIIGGPESGKSILMDALGIPVINTCMSTSAGVMRRLKETESKAIALEDCCNNPRFFGFEQLKPLFNGRLPRSKATKAGEIEEDTFSGGIIFYQQQSMKASQALKSRTLSIELKPRKLSVRTNTALESLILSKQPIAVNGFSEQSLDIILYRYEYACKKLAEKGIGYQRIIINHALLYSIIYALIDHNKYLITGVYKTLEYITEMAELKQAELNEADSQEERA